MTKWHGAGEIRPQRFKCGHCQYDVASAHGYHSLADARTIWRVIAICPNCKEPTYFGARQIPGVSPGNAVNHVPDEINKLYEEARRCVSHGAFTGAVLLCRKLLMNIAVNMGAQAGEHFLTYVEFLAKSGYVPPNGSKWVDHIRKKGNEANHEIRLMEQAEADDLILFSEMLLKFAYEFPNKVK